MTEVYLKGLLEDSSEAARFYLIQALKATSNLPKGLNRSQVIAAFMEAAASTQAVIVAEGAKDDS
jgi:uncharacterized protein (DUF2336 family)